MQFAVVLPETDGTAACAAPTGCVRALEEHEFPRIGRLRPRRDCRRRLRDGMEAAELIQVRTARSKWRRSPAAAASRAANQTRAH